MPQLPEKPNRFRRGDSSISAARLNQIVGLIPRQIKGGGDSKISYFGDRPVVQSPPETGQLGATEIQNYISTAVVVAEYDNCLLCTVFNPPVGDPLILPDDSEVAGPGGPNFVPQTYDDSLGDSTSNTFKVQFYVAKPYLLQRRPWDGAVVSYNGRSAQIIFGGNANGLPYPTVGYREIFDMASGGGARLSSEVISPSYQKGEVLVILRCGTGYSDKNGLPIIWMDQNTGGRRWGVMPGAIVNPTSYYPVENYAILPKGIDPALPASSLYPAFIYSSGTELLSFPDGMEGNCWLMMLNNEPADVSRYYDCSFAHFADDGLPVYLYAGAPPYVVRRTTPGEPIGFSHSQDMTEDPAGDDIPSPYGAVNDSFFSNGIFINICTGFALPGGSNPVFPTFTTNAIFAYVGAGVPDSPYGDMDSGTIEGRLLVGGAVIESNGIVAGEVTVGDSPAPAPAPGNDGVRNKMHYADAGSGLHVQVGGLYVGPNPAGPFGSILLTQSQAVWYIDTEKVLENIRTILGREIALYATDPLTPGTEGIVFQSSDGLTLTGPKISLGGSYMANTVLPNLVTILAGLGLIEDDTTP